MAVTGPARLGEETNAMADPLSLSKNEVTVVLGMHRSGTSLTSHLLSLLGLDMADEISPDANNPRGHWERWEIVAMNSEVLHYLGQDFYDPGHARPLPNGWWVDPAIRRIRDRIIAWLSDKMAGSPAFGFKEPRIGRLFPMWWEIFAHLGLRPRFIYCLRQPEAVAASLMTRDRFSRSDGLYRWLVYNADIVNGLAGHPVTIIPYESWFSDPLSNMRLLAEVAMRPDDDVPALRKILDMAFDPALRHHDGAGLPQVTGTGVCTQFHHLLRAHTQRGPLGAESRLAARLCDGFSEILEPLQAEIARLSREMEAPR
jgi:hypothetical protein